ncbi:MAG: relaxase/mobilization nuclease domain-containing protein [Clostridia bacterium]|nr:relaxase/mobilization nuclease domain-containing protein [Clostridia bacterium]
MAIVKLVSSKATPCEGIKYIINPLKAAVVTSRNLDKTEDFAMQMIRTAKLWKKAQRHKDRKYYHLKISFAKEDWKENGGMLSEEKAIQIANQMMIEFFNTKESVIAAHTDTDILHVHGIINAVDLFDGKMIDMRDYEYRKLKDRVQELCRENGLKDIDWREAVKEKREKEIIHDAPVKESFAEKGIKMRDKFTWKDTLRIVIDNAIENCCTMSEFKEYLSKQGIELTRCTEVTISYKLGEHKACRGDTLGGDYTATAIRDALEKNRTRRIASMPSKRASSGMEELIYAVKEYGNDVTIEERTVFRKFGREVGFKRAEIDELLKYRNPLCSEEMKEQAWSNYLIGKERFWNEYKERNQAIRKAVNDAYKLRRKVKAAEWAIDPRNRHKTFFGLIFALIVFSRGNNLYTIEREIEELKRKQEALHRSISVFKNTAESAYKTLKMDDLPIESYMESVKHIQNLADELHRKGGMDRAVSKEVSLDVEGKSKKCSMQKENITPGLRVDFSKMTEEERFQYYLQRIEYNKRAANSMGKKNIDKNNYR